jgi:trans-feruloyl-CoA hydratase/vanillin synthase
MPSSRFDAAVPVCHPKLGIQLSMSTETPSSERPQAEMVTVEVRDHIACVGFNRPEKRNAMSPRLNRQMALVLDDLEFRADVGVLVLTGNGSAFTAGMDLQEYFRDNEAKGLPAIRAAQRESYGWWRRLRWFQKPTIAMVNGWCFGGGYAPLFACDLAFAAEEAQFGLSEINWGILPGGCATKIARELVSFRRAMYHALTGETIDGRTAAAWGFVNEAVPLEKLRVRVEQVCQILLQKNPVALKAAKDAVRRVGEMTYDNAEDYLVRAQEAANSFDSTGRKEAMKQFLDDKSFKPGLGTYDRSKESASKASKASKK